MTDQTNPKEKPLKPHLMSLGEFINQRVDHEGVTSCRLLRPCIEEYLKLAKKGADPRTLIEWREIEKTVRSMNAKDWEAIA